MYSKKNVNFYELFSKAIDYSASADIIVTVITIITVIIFWLILMLVPKGGRRSGY